MTAGRSGSFKELYGQASDLVPSFAPGAFEVRYPNTLAVLQVVKSPSLISTSYIAPLVRLVTCRCLAPAASRVRGLI